jgi:hypothetical protein
MNESLSVALSWTKAYRECRRNEIAIGRGSPRRYIPQHDLDQ